MLEALTSKLILQTNSDSARRQLLLLPQAAVCQPRSTALFGVPFRLGFIALIGRDHRRAQEPYLSLRYEERYHFSMQVIEEPYEGSSMTCDVRSIDGSATEVDRRVEYCVCTTDFDK